MSSSDEDSDNSIDGYTSITGGRVGQLPLLAEDIELDDENATVVFVFPKGTEAGGTIDREAVKENAAEEAEKIFFMPKDFYPVRLRSLNRLEEIEAGGEEVTEDEFQELVRADFLSILQHGGMEASSSMSIDGDETFLKVCLPTKSERFSEVAEHYRYRMPVRADVYEPATNGENLEVPVFLEYTSDNANKLEDFNNIDEIRLIMRWLCERVSLDEMHAQRVIARTFPGADYRQIKHLSSDWANLSARRIVCPATYQNVESVRSYYGERIAFFFLWFATYKVQLLFLAIASAVVRGMKFFDLGDYSAWVPNLFVVYLSLWVVIFNETFKRKCARFAQHWGMKDWNAHEGDKLSSYDEQLEQTSTGDCWKFMAPFATITYVLLFAGAILGISLKNASMRMAGDMRLATWQPYIVAYLMKVCSFVWGKMAIVVVGWENHRTQSRLDDSLAWTLASVKLFVALFPFVSLAFLETFVNQTCKATLAEAAVEIYKYTGWPSGTTPYNLGIDATSVDGLNATHLEFLERYTWPSDSGMQCVAGCFPIRCRQATPEDAGSNHHHPKWTCDDYCEDNIETQLVSFYALQVLSAFIFLLIPIILTKVEIVSEIVKVSGGQKSNKFCAVFRSLFGCRAVKKGGTAYSVLQYQAKCHDSAAYEYNSWGGSFCEDFLDVSIGYSLLACFSQLKPSMVIVGVIAHFLIYRILAYRMLNVTCRPWPQGAEGIGIWQSIMDTIATLAVTCNVALSTFFMPPIKHYPLEHKFLFFILAEKGLLGLRTLVGAMVPDEPGDVTVIYDKHAEVEKVLTTSPLGSSPKTCDFSKIKLGL